MIGKKIFLFAYFSFFFICSSSIAQRFNAGIIAGFTATQVSGDKLAGYDKPGFQFGALASTALSQKFDVSFQILYTQKGSKRKSRVDQGDFEYYRMRLNYIEVPLMVTYKYSKRFHFESGISFGRLVSSKEEDQYGEILDRKEFKNYEFGFLAGMNYMLLDNFYLNLQISNSILPIRDFDGSELYRLDRDQFNSGLLFTFKYIFKKKTEVQ